VLEVHETYFEKPKKKEHDEVQRERFICRT
jgi:hypothetical protein